ncbi:MAG: hypothetical protein ACR2PI_02640 [Hyphomicrobiaceae bacterium]
MRFWIIIALSAWLAAAMSTLVAAADKTECRTFGYSVNDYGKKGPTEDAKKLLDKYIAEYAQKHGIESYKAGDKTVSCKLFLDFGFFDEHMCKAEAEVCWREKQKS